MEQQTQQPQHQQTRQQHSPAPGPAPSANPYPPPGYYAIPRPVDTGSFMQGLSVGIFVGAVLVGGFVMLRASDENA